MIRAFYTKTVTECNETLDELKMQGDYQGIINLMIVNREMLLSAGWKPDTIIKHCEKIIELHNLI